MMSIVQFLGTIVTLPVHVCDAKCFCFPPIPLSLSHHLRCCFDLMTVAHIFYFYSTCFFASANIYHVNSIEMAFIGVQLIHAQVRKMSEQRRRRRRAHKYRTIFLIARFLLYAILNKYSNKCWKLEQFMIRQFDDGMANKKLAHRHKNLNWVQ